MTIVVIGALRIKVDECIGTADAIFSIPVTL